MSTSPVPPLLAALRPRRVCVFRALQLGDMLCAVPALRALRGALPGARITLIGLPWARAFAARFCAYIDDFIAYPGHPALPEQAADPAAYPGFLAKTRRRGFDLAIQLHGNGRLTNAIVEELGARTVAGFWPGPPHPSRPADAFLPYPNRGSEIHRLLALTSFLGAPPRGEHLEFPLRPADHAERAACAAIRELPENYVCLHPGARSEGRRWPAASFAAVGEALYHGYGLTSVITGSDEEAALATRVAEAMEAPALRAALPVSAGALAAVLAGARLLVCNDTGVAHIAAALRLPSVIVFRASQMARWAPLDGQAHRPVWAPAETDLDPALSAEARAAVLRHARVLLQRSACATPRPLPAATAPAPGRSPPPA